MLIAFFSLGQAKAFANLLAAQTQVVAAERLVEQPEVRLDALLVAVMLRVTLHVVEDYLVFAL